jgi:hypothetical protein
VIPGGAYSIEEMRRARMRDPIVEAHYSDFDLARAKVVHLHNTQMAYVSYRLGSQIFWTKKQLHLAKGEVVLTDGKRQARARCGNQISAKPQGKTSPLEPEEQAFNAKIPPQSKQAPIANQLIAELPASRVPPLPYAVPPVILSSAPSSGSGVPAGSGYVPVFTPGIPGTTLRSQPPPPAVPEPATLLLVGSGLVLFGARLRKKSSDRS